MRGTGSRRSCEWQVRVEAMARLQCHGDSTWRGFGGYGGGESGGGIGGTDGAVAGAVASGGGARAARAATVLGAASVSAEARAVRGGAEAARWCDPCDMAPSQRAREPRRSQRRGRDGVFGKVR